MPATLTEPSSLRPADQNAAAMQEGLQVAGLSSCGAGSADLVVESATLLRGHKTVAITHNGATYRLHSTRLGKLILTK